MKNKSEKQFVKLLMLAYTAGYEKGTGKDIDFSRWWLANKDVISEYFLEVTMEVINEIKDEYNENLAN
jgi:hypothetical protein